jgi:hypothetical protein
LQARRRVEEDIMDKPMCLILPSLYDDIY